MTGTHRLLPALLAAALLVAPAAVASGQGTAAGPDTTERTAADTIFGRSGRLLARFFAPPRSMEVEPIARLFGKREQKNTSTVAVTDSASGRQLSLITLLPFANKVNGRVGDYHLGRFPAEKRAPRSAAYENPDGFIEVTLENKDTPVSEHFRLVDFLTHDQKNVWPKYLVLREALVDKLELVLVELQRRGIDAQRLRVTSGFRSPQYNQRGVTRGRAKDSRHQYGDAADIMVDNNADNRLDDLNRDGRVNSKDMRILAEAVESVERQYPELIGGLGLYRANSARGPFIHVDVRGQRARWGRY
ncbi:MAG: DUF882 domain-containing protein [Gemmatimonadaceae bacterium]|nr:DUF882 domain-containing protein [Gemmatimonadaceae bacterium]